MSFAETQHARISLCRPALPKAKRRTGACGHRWPFALRSRRSKSTGMDAKAGEEPDVVQGQRPRLAERSCEDQESLLVLGGDG